MSDPLYASPGGAAAWEQGQESRDALLGPATETLLDLAGIGPGDRVLDVAAGTGEQTVAAARRVGPGGQIFATDVAAAMLERAAASARGAGLDWVTTRVMDGHNLALDDAGFDAVICRLGLMYLTDRDRALAGMRRVLRPGGRLAAMVWSSPERNPALALPLAVGHRYAGPASPPPEEVEMFALCQPETLVAAYERAGFRDVTVRPVATLRRYPTAADAVRDQQVVFVRLHKFFEGLSVTERTRAWGEVEEALRRFEGPGGYEAHGEVLVAVGTRAAR